MLKQTIVQEKLSDLTKADEKKLSDNDETTVISKLMSRNVGNAAGRQAKLKGKNLSLVSLRGGVENGGAGFKENNGGFEDADSQNDLDFDGAETLGFFSANSLINSNLARKQSKTSLLRQQNDSELFDSNHNNNNSFNKIKYLEKSIKFLQQQHNETLNSLHQEIENLRNENRG